jgi:hypothetical protein
MTMILTGWIISPLVCLLVTLASIFYLYISDYSFYTYDDGTFHELQKITVPIISPIYQH